MGDEFDPYYTWLAIPPEEQPPNHYRLIGVREFEDNEDVISNAMDQRMAHLRTFQNGKRASFSQGLLNEVAAAGACLLNPAKKSAYDEQLAAEMHAFEEIEEAVGSDEEVVGTAEHVAPSIPAPPAPGFDGLVSGRRPRLAARRQSKGNGRLLLGLAVLFIAGGGLLAAIYFVVNAKKDDGPSSDQKVAKSDEKKAADKKTKKKSDAKSRKKTAGSDKKKTDKQATTKKGGPVTKVTTKNGSRAAVDLLSMIDPDQHQLQGTVRRSDEGLLALDSETGNAAVCLPYEFPTSYQLKMRFLREKGGGPIAVALMVGGQLCNVVLDAFPQQGYLSGLEMLNGRRINAVDYGAVKKGQLIETNKFADVVITVIGNRVVGVCSSSRFLEWRGDTSRLSTPPGIEKPQLITSESRYLFHQISIRPMPITLVGMPKKKSPKKKTLVPTKRTSPLNPGPFNPTAPAIAEVQEVPAAAAQEVALAKIKESFKPQYAAAKLPEQRVELSEELANMADKSADDPTTRFVLLKEAQRLAIAGKQLGAATTLRDQLTAGFKIDKSQNALEFLRQAQSVMKNTEERRELARVALDFVSELLSRRDYDLAMQCAEVANRAAQKARDVPLRKRVREQLNQVRVAKARLDRARAAEKALETKPDDPAANLTWGKHLCFFDNQWQQGLSHLAKSSHPGLRRVAAMEITKPASPTQTKQLADAWWALGQSGPDHEKLACLVRAQEWYKSAAQQLKGLDQKQVQNRMTEVETAIANVRENGSRTLGKKPTTGTQLPGLLGRLVVDGRPVPVPMHYEDGTMLSAFGLRQALQEKGIRGQRVQGVFRTVFDLPASSPVVIVQRGTRSSSGAMSCALLLDGKPLGQAGGRAGIEDVHELSLKAGRHLVEWRVTSGNGSCSIQFFKGATRTMRLPVSCELPATIQKDALIRLPDRNRSPQR